MVYDINSTPEYAPFRQPAAIVEQEREVLGPFLLTATRLQATMNTVDRHRLGYTFRYVRMLFFRLVECPFRACTTS